MRDAPQPGRARHSAWRIVVAVVTLSLLGAACSTKKPEIAYTGDPKPPPSPARITDVLKADKDQRFTKLLELIDAVGLTEKLTEPGPITFFAPTDAALTSLPSALTDPKTVGKDEKAKTKVVELLDLHIVNKDVVFSDPPVLANETADARKNRLTKAGTVVVSSSQSLESMLDGTKLDVSSSKTVKVVGSTTSARIIQADLAAPNGYIQVIDKLLAK